jgi:hypothetical protein
MLPLGAMVRSRGLSCASSTRRGATSSPSGSKTFRPSRRGSPPIDVRYGVGDGDLARRAKTGRAHSAWSSWGQFKPSRRSHLT